MEGNFQHEALKKCVAVICQSIGFQGIYSMPLEVLTDLLHRYLREIAVLTHRFAEHDNRTLPTLGDLSYTFNELKISLPELEEFVSSVESVPFPDVLPKLPLPRPSQLNLLKPGSREIVSRPIHIHEHLPPMLPDKEEEDSKDGLVNGAGGGDGSTLGSTDGPNAAEDQDGGAAAGDQASQRHQGGGSPSHFSSLLAAAASKRSSDSEASAAKRFNVDGEGEPVREIDSVIMTTSGFISSAREGKLPDARLPDIPLPTLPHHTPASRASGGGSRGGSSSTNGSHSIQTNATIKKKMSLERLMRHKHNLALKKKASAAAQQANATPSGGSASHSGSKSKSAKKSLSHSAVMSMAGAAVDSSLCFTTKHGKSKDKVKPKIPSAPPGTSRLMNPAVMSAENQQHFINSTCNVSKRPNALLNTPIGSLPPPKLKIPTPKMKQPEFSTDVLPLPKEDVQEQQERKLQIMKKEEKQKELARAAKNGMLGSLVGGELADGSGSVGGAAGAGGRILTPGGRAPSLAGLNGSPLPSSAGKGQGSGVLPETLLSKIKKEKKEKEGKKELKKSNKDDKKDKEKRDKEKRELKKEKILKKKEEKEKRDKDKKDEKKREKEAKKLKDASKKDKELKKNKEGKKSKDGKVKEKDPLKKEKKELKKIKKVTHGSATPKSSHLKEASNLSFSGHDHSQPILSNTSDSFPSRPPLSVTPLNTLTNPMSSTSVPDAIVSPLSPDAGKSKLCIFKKNNNKSQKEVSSNDFPEKKNEPLGAQGLDSSSLQAPATSHSFVGGVDLSADLSGVISSPSVMETPKSSLDKPVKPRKRKKPEGTLGAKATDALGSPKAKKPKKEKGIGTASKSKSPKGGASGVMSMGIPNNPVDVMDDNATPFAALGMMSGTPMSHWDSRPLTPGSHDTSPGISSCPPTPGMLSLPPFGHVPLPPHASPFSPQNMCMDAFGTAANGSDILERPLTPGGQFLHGRGGTPDMSFSNPPVVPMSGSSGGVGGFSSPLSPGISEQSPATSVSVLGGAAPPLSTAPTVGGGQSTPSQSASDSDKKKKEKEHRREKKEKDKIKKKKDKKDKGGKVEKKLKDKQKKEKKKKKGLVAGISPAVLGRSDGPGIALPPAEVAPISDPQVTQPPATPKIVIKRSEPSNPSSSVSSFSVTSSSNLAKEDQPGSPELAKISALITRPPKPSSTKDKTKSSSSRGGSSSRDVVSSSCTVLPGPSPSSSSPMGGLPSPPMPSSVSVLPVPSSSSPAMMVKCTDVVSLPTLKIREIKSSSASSKDRDYGGIRPPTSQEDDFGGSGLQQHQVVPPLKIKQHSVPPPLPEEKAGVSKKSPPAAFGSTSPHRSSKPGKKPTLSVPTTAPLAVAATAASTAASIGHFVDDKGNEFWVCPSCGKQDDGSPMIGCDTCDDWYHWVCVGIQVPPNEAENWYCPRCLAQHKQRSLLGAPSSKKDKKRHHHRKKK